MNSLVASRAQIPGSHAAPLRGAPVDKSPLKEIIGIIMQRAKLAAIVGGVVMALVMLAVMMMPKMYYASGALLIEPKRENLARAVVPNTAPGLPDTSAIDTQVEMLRSPVLAKSVAEKLNLFNLAEFNPYLKRGEVVVRTQGPSPKEVTAVTNAVQSHARIRRSGLTYIVQVGFVSKSPEMAERIANAYMETFLERQLSDHVTMVAQANQKLDAQVERMRAEATAAEERVQQYKIANNLYSAAGSTIAEQEVSALNTQVAAAQAEAAEKSARLQAALQQVQRGSGGADVTAAVGSDTIKELRKSEAEKSARLAQLLTDFKPEYPEVKRVQAEVDEIRVQIQAELNRIMSSVRADANASSQRAGSLLSSRGRAQGGLVQNNRALVGLVALEQRAKSATAIYEAYLNRAKELSAEGTLQQPDASVNSPAVRPIKAYSPNRKLGAVFALLIGLFAAAVTIVVAEFWDRRLRSRIDVEDYLGVPFAGVLPQLKERGSRAGVGQSARLVKSLTDNRYSSFAESFRNLRAFLTLGAGSSLAKVLAVTSSLPQEGKSVTSMCLARTLAMGGSSVVLVDCDLRRQGSSRMLGNVRAGLAEVLEGSATLDQVLVQDSASGAWLLPAASSRRPPCDLFTNEATERLLKTLSERFDHVVLDLPPIFGVADARLLAALADRVIYLVRWNKTAARTAQSGIDILRESGANVVGAVLTQVDVDQQARYGYCDSSDYFRQYQQYYLAPGE